MAVDKEIFHTEDYVVFGVSLLISAAIGMFYAFADRKSTSTQELLMGGRSMKVFPVAMSVFATSMSAITLLGTPAEIYRFGSQYFMIVLCFCIVIPATAYIYMPVFHQLQLTSAYQYLELRFHRSLRTIGSAVFILHMLMYMPVVLYAPALALSEVTGLGVWTAVLSIGLVCTFYTSIGGIKAVVWTDVFQAILMFAAILVVVIKGASDLGGMSNVWKIAVEGNRIEFFDFNFDPLVRHTFWSLVFGGALMWTGTFAASQSMVQRYLTIASLNGAKICLWINLPALFFLIIITSLCGLVIYALYATCDPIGAKIIDSPDQLFPRFVMEILGSMPGLPGLFVSGIFSGALSTISSGVNALSAITLEDFIKAYFVKNLSEVWATRLTKIVAVLYGLLAIALVRVAEQLGGVLQAALTIHGVIGGPMLGIFSLGMFFPFANTLGALCGLASGLVVSMWFGMGSFAMKPYVPQSPMSYVSCPELYFNATGIDIFNMTNETTIVSNNEDIFLPYRLSYLWLSGVGFIAVLVIGGIVSLLSGCNKGECIDERLLSPVVLSLLKLYYGGRKKEMTLHKGVTNGSLSTIGTTIGETEFYGSNISVYHKTDNFAITPKQNKESIQNVRM